MAVKQECDHTEIHIICPQCDGKPPPAARDLTVLSHARARFDSDCKLCPDEIYEGEPMILVETSDGDQMWVHVHHAKES